MTPRGLFLALGLAMAVANVAALVLIMAALDRRKQKTNMLLARLYPYKYVKAYKETTRRETGKTGPLHALWVVSLILTLILAVTAVLMPGG